MYAYPAGRYDVLCAALVDDDGPAWVFDVLNHPTGRGHTAVQLRLSTSAGSALSDAPGFFADFASECPDTLDNVRRILDRNGFTAVDPGPWTEGQR
ncbi:hypothetical protein [Micromonospora sp. CA-248212]|uniref:hypothetical protein n=1 Tax=Micromonospora sp. CA-248212 TaxID=3239961 RepID=UPI003D8DE608